MAPTCAKTVEPMLDLLNGWHGVPKWQNQSRCCLVGVASSQIWLIHRHEAWACGDQFAQPWVVQKTAEPIEMLGRLVWRHPDTIDAKTHCQYSMHPHMLYRPIEWPTWCAKLQDRSRCRVALSQTWLIHRHEPWACGDQRAQPWVVQNGWTDRDARLTRMMSFQTRCRYSIHPHMLYRPIEWRRHAQKWRNRC